MFANRLSGATLRFALFSVRIAVLMLVIRGGIASAQPYSVLHNFDSAQSDGFNPQGSLALDASGNLWGTTLSGSTYSPNFAGTVFKFTPPSTLTTIYSFQKSDGTNPNGLTLSPDGNFYGTAGNGGSSSCTTILIGCGTIFKVTPAGAFSLLYQFDGAHGAQPYGLVLGSDGNLYGVTFLGGTYGAGTFFEITPAGNYSVLYNFTGADGSPIAPLAAGSNGTFYGATYCCGTYGGGVVFKITTAGQFSVLYNLHQAGNETVSNVAALTVGGDGNIYGTALDQQILLNQQQNYYCPTWCGTIFELTPQGEMSNLYNFSNLAQGGDPFEITQGIDGNFYGLAQGGAITPECSTGCGVVFKVTSEGSYSILHNVDGTDG
ncbi:MAG TPA: choice-of-anchor tandem repeat GloVer-containing protein [Terriglobales bacterium]|nr:choice-of-anchor tandem repeat GloVer-containing protein [Terriglobales bacterium]